MNKKKGIILAAPVNFGFGDIIKKELIKQGFEVIDLSAILQTPFKYKNIFQRTHNLLRKIFFKDMLFKKKLKEQFYYNSLDNEISKVNFLEYALFIRPDMYPMEIISKIRLKVNNLIAYQWDGLNRFPEVLKYIPLFDSFYVFDRKDADEYPSTIPCTNFYFPRSFSQNHANYTYFVGGFFQDRLELLVDIKRVLDNLNFNHKIIFSSDSQRAKKSILESGFYHIKNDITYENNLVNVGEAAVLVDIQNPIHDGPSFRIFESIGYDKKLITTNKNIKKYDFYNSSNILIWDNQSDSEIQEFYNKPYEPIASSIKQKYSFENWIKFILKIDGYIPIDIPK